MAHANAERGIPDDSIKEPLAQLRAGGFFVTYRESVNMADNDTLIYLAAGVLEVTKRRFAFPYPDAFRYALNRLSVLMLEKGEKPPRDLAEWVDKLEQPLGEWWPLDLPDGVSNDFSLMFKLEPEEWLGEYLDEKGLLDVLDIKSLWYFQGEVDNADMRSLIRWCRDNNKPDLYIGVRQFLIRHPYITAAQWTNFVQEFPYKLPFNINTFYSPLGVQHLSPQKNYWECPHCGGVLTWFTDNYKNRTPVSSQYTRENTWVLKMGHHWRACVPGKPEIQLYDWANEVASEQMELESAVLWPDIDRYDLRLTFSDGTAWGVDVKDISDPYRLRRIIEKDISEIDFLRSVDGLRWDQFFFVVPDYRIKWISGYIPLSTPNNLPGNVRVLGLRKFSHQVANKVGKSLPPV